MSHDDPKVTRIDDYALNREMQKAQKLMKECGIENFSEWTCECGNNTLKIHSYLFKDQSLQFMLECSECAAEPHPLLIALVGLRGQSHPDVNWKPVDPSDEDDPDAAS